jgi:hypothetical protein
MVTITPVLLEGIGKPYNCYEPEPEYIEAKNNLFNNVTTLIHQPTKEQRQTFFHYVHGRDFSAEIFAPVLLLSTTTENETLQSAFPHARLVFPTALESHPDFFSRNFNRKTPSRFLSANGLTIIFPRTDIWTKNS